MSSLYQLTDQYQALLDFGSSCDPEDQQAFLDTLEGLKGEVSDKVDAYAAVRTTLVGRRETVKKELDRLAVILKTIDNNIDRMDDAVQGAMDVMGVTELKSDLHKYKIVKNGGKAPLVYDGAVPDNFQRIIIQPDTERIRAALERGEQLPFAHLGERGTHLRIS